MRALVAGCVSLALLLAVPGCRCGSAPGTVAGDAAGSASAQPTVSADPEGVIAELRIAAPSAVWESLRGPLAGVAPLRPASLSALAVAAGVPAGYAPQISGDVPLVGVVGERGSELAWVVSVHVRSGRELVAALTTGSAPTHRPSQNGGLTVLEPLDPRAPVLGMLDQRLLVAGSAADLARWGRFVAQTLPGRPSQPGPIVATLRRRSLAGPLARMIEHSWSREREELSRAERRSRERHGGRAPDFAEPVAALDLVGAVLERALAVLRGAEELTLVLDAKPDRADFTVRLTPRAEGAARELERSLAAADVRRLGELPTGTLIALATHSAAEERLSFATQSSAVLANLFAGRLSEPERRTLEGTLTLLAKSRGAQATYALVHTGGEPAAVLRADVVDERAFDAAARRVLELFRIPAVAEPLRQFAGIRGVELGTTTLAGVPGAVNHGAFRSAAAGAGGVEVVWTSRGTEVFGVAGRTPAPLLRSLVNGVEPGARLSSDPVVTGALERAGEHVNLALLAQPLLLRGSAQVAGAAPVLVSFGRSGRELSLRLEVAWAALPALLGAGAEIDGRPHARGAP